MNKSHSLETHKLNVCRYDSQPFLTAGLDVEDRYRKRYQFVHKGNNKITENSEQSSKGKVKTHKYINKQNQSTTGKP